MAKKYFRDETGMYIDWAQLEKLPEVDTLIDIGVGPMGTPDLYARFKSADLILVDPLSESLTCVDELKKERNVEFIQTALGETTGALTINIEGEIGRSSLLEVAEINYEGDPVEVREVTTNRLDNVVPHAGALGNIGIKIDTEGFELNVIRGAPNVLKHTLFVLAEVRHNHESIKGSYKLHEFMHEMTSHGFVLTNILTAKPFIADLCFRPVTKMGL